MLSLSSYVRCIINYSVYFMQLTECKNADVSDDTVRSPGILFT